MIKRNLPSPSPKLTPQTKQEFVPGELIVKLASANDTLDSFESSLGAKVVEQFDLPVKQLDSNDGPMVRLKLSDTDTVGSALERLRQDERIDFAEPNLIYTLDEATNPPNDLHEKLWGLNNTGQTGGKAGACLLYTSPSPRD